MSNTQALQAWIHPDYVDRYVTGTLGGYLDSVPFENAVLPDFFLPERLDAIEAYCAGISTEKNLDYGLGRDSSLRWGAFGEGEVLRFLYSAPFLAFLGQLLGEPVRMKAEAIPQYNRFSPGSRGLPVHTDFEDQREIVMLFQLTKFRSEDGGGELCLHSSSRREDVVKKIVPRRNTLTLFKVSPESFHSVADMSGQWTRELLLFDWFRRKQRQA